MKIATRDDGDDDADVVAGPKGDGAERRAAERHDVALEGWLRTADARVIGVAVLDISTSGAGVSMLVRDAVDAGDLVEVALEMASPSDETWTPGIVRWRDGLRLGIQFRAGAVATRRMVLVAIHERAHRGT